MAKKANLSEKGKYISESWCSAMKYKRDVKTGKQITSHWIKLAIARSDSDSLRKDIYHCREAVERVYEYFYFTRIKSGSRYQRFQPSAYQAWIIYEIFGWYYNTGARRFNYAIIYTARKSGKTVFSVLIETYMLIYDYEPDPEVYLCATTREQAGQGLRYAKNIVKKSPALNKRLEIRQFHINYPKQSGILKVLANKPDANDSLNPYCYIIDEMHAHKTLDFFNVMKSGTMERDNPLGIITSTAGFHKDYPFYTMVENGKKVLHGTIKDDTTFYALFTLDDEDEVENYKCWVKSNPNIGVTIKLERLRAEFEKAKLMPTEMHNFITKNLNRYLDSLENFIPDEVYKKGFISPAVPGNKPKAYAGLDLSANRDLASLVIVYTDPETGKLAVIPEFYFPQNETKRVRNSGIDLREWIEQGFIIEHQSPTINMDLIFERISFYNDIFNIEKLNYDKFNSSHIVSNVMSKLYINCQHFEQNAKWFNFPLKYIEKQSFENQIFFSNNPVLRWMFSNIVLWQDGNGNIKIMKNKSQDSVDGAVSMTMAVAGWLEFNDSVMASFFNELFNINSERE